MNAPEFAPSDFFSRQSAAKARTGRLAALFIGGVVATACAIHLAAVLCFGAAAKRYHTGEAPGIFDPHIFLPALIGTAVVIGCASLFKMWELSGAGGKIAESVGGRIVDLATNDPAERRLVNVVREMCVASGAPMPEIYILRHDSGLNAFAAGDDPEHAAVAVTRGLLDNLTREELQAVVAHEFSHILNGDMRLNIRLSGVIFGLLVITIIGRALLHASPRRDSESSKKNAAPLILFGMLILVIGFIANFFAEWIQASISRQREHLADASATQFTRNPEALANALRRILGAGRATRLADATASQIAHMCFCPAVRSMFATHPPLEDRIRLLKPDWDGSALPRLTPVEITRHEPAPAVSSEALRKTPELLRTPLGAQAGIIMLMMADSPGDDAEQARRLKQIVSPELFEKLKASWGFAAIIHRPERLAIARLAAPALGELSPDAAGEFLDVLRELAHSDREVSEYEQELFSVVAEILESAS